MTKDQPKPCRVTVYMSAVHHPDVFPVKTFDLKEWPEETESSMPPVINLIGVLTNGKQWEIYTQGPVIIEEL